MPLSSLKKLFKHEKSYTLEKADQIVRELLKAMGTSHKDAKMDIEDKDILGWAIGVGEAIIYIYIFQSDEKTLFIATSYSGNTKEVLNSLDEAQSKGCVIYAITSGGKLGEKIRAGEIPGYIFSTRYNPSKAPRTSIGYTIGATLGLMARLGHLEFAIKEFNDFVDFVEAYTKILLKDSTFTDDIATKIESKMPVFVTSEHLVSASHIWRNFLNETSKNIAFSYNIPQMNHHFLDGLKYPQSARENLMFVFIQSSLHKEKNRVRLKVSRDVVKKFGYKDVGIDLNGGTKLKEIFELIILGHKFI